MTTPELVAAIAGARQEDVPALAMALAARLAQVGSTMNGHRPEPKQEVEVWITPEAAAGIACVPKERIYSWAQGQRWASRPSRRCLRISEQGFRRWLGPRRS